MRNGIIIANFLENWMLVLYSVGSRIFSDSQAVSRSQTLNQYSLNEGQARCEALHIIIHFIFMQSYNLIDNEMDT